MWKKLVQRALLLLAFFLLAAPPAYAYLDPGTGSYACQLLLAAAFGFAFVVKANFDRIKAWLAGFFSKDVKG
jgi:hypothetical protein